MRELLVSGSFFGPSRQFIAATLCSSLENTTWSLYNRCGGRLCEVMVRVYVVGPAPRPENQMARDRTEMARDAKEQVL